MEEEEDIGRVGEQEDDDGGPGRLIDTPSNLPGLPDLSDPFVLPDPSDAGADIAAVDLDWYWKQLSSSVVLDIRFSHAVTDKEPTEVVCFDCTRLLLLQGLPEPCCLFSFLWLLLDCREENWFCEA